MKATICLLISIFAAAIAGVLWLIGVFLARYLPTVLLASLSKYFDDELDARYKHAAHGRRSPTQASGSETLCMLALISFSIGGVVGTIFHVF